MVKKRRSKYLIPAIALAGAGILGAIALQSVAATGGGLPPPTKYSCVNGQCVADPNGPYSSLADCQATCISQLPTGCASDSDCPTGYQCVNGQCVPITTPLPPPPSGGAYVIFNTDPPGGTATINGQLVKDNTTIQLPIGSVPIMAGPSPPDIPPFHTYQFIEWRLTYSSASGWGAAPPSLFSAADPSAASTTLNIQPQPTSQGAYVYLIEALYYQSSAVPNVVYVGFNTYPPGGTATIGGTIFPDNTQFPVQVGQVLPIIAGPPPAGAGPFTKWLAGYSSEKGRGGTSLFTAANPSATSTSATAQNNSSLGDAVIYLLAIQYGNAAIPPNTYG